MYCVLQIVITVYYIQQSTPITSNSSLHCPFIFSEDFLAFFPHHIITTTYSINRDFLIVTLFGRYSRVLFIPLLSMSCMLCIVSIKCFARKKVILLNCSDCNNYYHKTGSNILMMIIKMKIKLAVWNRWTEHHYDTNVNDTKNSKVVVQFSNISTNYKGINRVSRCRFSVQYSLQVGYCNGWY